jgi:Holliday junction resolvasome RuvABC endonuclease subunit
MMGIVTGIMQTIADCKKISLEWYSEGDSKKCLLGKRAAIKKDTKQAIAKLYPMIWTGTGYKDEAIADAMAVYHVATFNSSILKYLNK